MNTGYPAVASASGFAMPPHTHDWPFGDCKPLSYDLIMADPPWKTSLRTKKGYKKAPERHYKTMTFDEIASLPVGKLAAPDCVLMLWGLWSHIFEGKYTMRSGLKVPDPSYSPIGRIIGAWGFTYATGLPWVKRTRHGKLTIGTGYRVRGCTEPIFIATMGGPETSKSVRGIIETIDEWYGLIDAQRRAHSQKPVEAYEWAEAFFPNARKLDLFAGDPRPGWDRWAPQDHRVRA